MVEYTLSEINFAEKVRYNYIQENSDEIEILFLGSSQIERAINPKFIAAGAINLANSSQTLFEDFKLLKFFNPKLPKLKLVVLEISYDKLERDKSNILPILDPKNLKFYGVNTFGRKLKLQDHLLFHFSPKYFSKILNEYIFKTSNIKLNKFGFDENKFDGAYSHANYVLIENIHNKKNYKKNLLLLNEIISYCNENNLKIFIYHPPTHYRYNELRDPSLVKKWRKLIDSLKYQYPKIHFFIDDTNSTFTRKYFDDANHLNPLGAEKATKTLDSILQKYYPNL
ncbi:hypothetical protein [Christiangramia fulva]|nr:hypothetical protein [Christiangramia fulva]